MYNIKFAYGGVELRLHPLFASAFDTGEW